MKRILLALVISRRSRNRPGGQRFRQAAPSACVGKRFSTRQVGDNLPSDRLIVEDPSSFDPRIITHYGFPAESNLARLGMGIRLLQLCPAS
jgi:hypothetical protein